MSEPRPDLARAFRDTLAALHPDAADDLLPLRLSIAAASVVPADGASISFIHNALRLPLGASDARSSEAERLQFTQGTGPCLDAVHTGRAICVDAAQIARDYPALAELWQRQGHVRSAISLPLGLPALPLGALDLFWTSPDLPDLDPDDVRAVASLVQDELGMAPAGAPYLAADDPAGWLSGPAARGRRRAWVAVGILMLELDLTADDALARLRSFAFAHDRSVEDVTDELVADVTYASALRL